MCALALGLCACGRTPAPVSVSAPAATPFAADDRFAALLGPCAKNEAFLADTSDMIPVLVSKLAKGQVDPLHYAKSELGAIGEPALPELRRLFDESYDDPQVEQRLGNVLGVVALMETDAGRDLALRGLQHPAETVRQSAARALERHPRPEDYEALSSQIPIASPDLASDLALAMLACDRARLERDLAGWLEGDKQKKLVRLLMPRVCDTHDPDIVARLGAVRAHADADVRVWLDAVAAGAGDEAARARLFAALKDENPAQRSQAAQALQLIGRTAELASRVTEDPSEENRAWLAHQLAQLPASPATTEALRAGLADSAAVVREACLGGLLSLGDAAAADTALEMLQGVRAELEMAMRVLHDPMARDAHLAARAFAILKGLHDGDILPVRCDPHALEHAIGVIPSEAAARYLCAIADRPALAGASGATGAARGQGANGVSQDLIQGLPAHRWYLQAAGNTGPAGRAYLRSLWPLEVDPLRRMDLVMAAAYEKTPESQAFLEKVVESERATPFEVLQAADLLTRFGHWSEVAPLLKRVALRVSDPEVRPALNCLLWKWFGRSD